ncbi:MAG: hypothetical protein JST54_21150 [Deltaproteobacteria bacterium]|nr:hypothetical protein [Deltaproteobacteria bacterium]
MRIALIVVAVLLAPSVARASCSDPAFCICQGAGATVLEAKRQSGSSYAVTSVFGATPSGGAPTAITSNAASDDILVGFTSANAQVIFDFDADGKSNCPPHITREQTKDALLEGVGCGDELQREGLDRECHDTGVQFCGTGSAPSLGALALVLLALRRGR